MRGLTFHEEAGAEVNEAATYYEARVPGLGVLFLGALEEAVQNVQAHPEAGQLVGSEIRRTLIRRFPYSQPPVCHRVGSNSCSCGRAPEASP